MEERILGGLDEFWIVAPQGISHSSEPGLLLCFSPFSEEAHSDVLEPVSDE